MSLREHFHLTPDAIEKLRRTIQDRGKAQKAVCKDLAKEGHPISHGTLTHLLKGKTCSNDDNMQARIRDLLKHLKIPADDALVEVMIEVGRPPDDASIPPEILAESLSAYYGDKIKDSGLKVYSALVDGASILTSVAFKPEWLGLAIPLKSGHEFCTIKKWGAFSETSHPYGNLKELSKYARLWKMQLEAAKAQERDDTIFWLQSLSLTRKTLHAEFAVGRFKGYKYTVGLLETELLEVLRKNDLKIRPTVDRLKLRDKILRNGHQLLDCGRPGSSGCMVLMAIARPSPYDDYVFLLQQRSKAVTDQVGMLTIIPQAFHSPGQKGDNMCQEWEAQLSETVLKEVYEEVFGGEEHVGRQKPGYSKEDTHDSPAIQWLVAHPEGWRMELVAHCCYLMSGDRDFVVLFAIHDPSFWEKYYKDCRIRDTVFKYNWESDDQVMAVSSKDRDELVKLLRTRAWGPEGLFAFVEASKRLREIDPKRGGANLA